MLLPVKRGTDASFKNTIAGKNTFCPALCPPAGVETVKFNAELTLTGGKRPYD